MPDLDRENKSEQKNRRAQSIKSNVLDAALIPENLAVKPKTPGYLQFRSKLSRHGSQKVIRRSLVTQS